MWAARPDCSRAAATGMTKKQAFDELRQIVEETITLYRKESKALPPPTSGRDFANRMQHVA